MENISLDRLYELFISTTNPMIRENMLKSYIFPCPENEGVLFEAKDYLLKNMGALPSFFKSEEKSEFENKKIRDLSKVFHLLAYAVDNHVSDIHIDAIERLKKEDPDTEKYIDDLYEDSGIFEPQHLFRVSPERIKDAYKAYYDQIDDVTPEAAAEAIALVKRVQDDGTIAKIFGSNKCEDISIDDLLITLYDYYNKDNSKFNTSYEDLYSDCEGFALTNYFNDIKNGFPVGAIDFKKYRPSLITKREFMLNIDRVIFARNILSYKKSGIMPSPNGFIDFFVDEEESEDLVDKLHEIYNKSFDNDKFKDMQSSPIFNVEKSLLKPELIEEIKAVRKGNSMALGALIASESSSACEYMRQFYLLHVYIDDVTNDKCKYEIQLNAIPEAYLPGRVQLMRLDNWERLQSHKNIGSKIQTTTHVHLYNHLDLLRGKTNGAYDIAYNFDEESSSFDDALKTFVIMMGADKALAKNIYNKVTKAKEKVSKSIEREL